MPVLESTSDQKYQHQLPTVSFRVVGDEKTYLSAVGVSSEQSRSYGYSDMADFERPDYYIRYIEPIESELKVQVEYDMDEQDQAWLDAINAERVKEQSGPIPYEVFEIIIDKLEKEWFELVKRIPQKASNLPVEDSKCAICDDGEGENSNAIVFCDGCNLAVHQDCYGVPYIPEGQWLCRKCTVSPEIPVSCLFCPNEGGAFKQTSTGHWSHLLCAIWIPELGVGNAIYMEPVDGVESIPKNRWKLICSLCRDKSGACIQCDNKSCFTAFHVTCARQAGFLMSMKALGADTQLRAFCEKHLPFDARSEVAEDESTFSGTPAPSRSRGRRASHNGAAVTTKSARAHAKSYRPGPPIVPNVIVQSLLDYVAKINIRKKQPFIERLCRYWSLKREARRGAPLLKRLHLEPWTASSAAKQQTDEEKALKLKLRNDLEKVRLLAELVRKREKEKLRQAQVVKEVVDSFLFPASSKLRLILEKISAMDRTELFHHPVNRLEVPDYFEVIKEPMCWLWIDEKLEENKYRDAQEFVRDINLVLDNAMIYNKGDTPFNRIAKRIKNNAAPLLAELNIQSEGMDHSDVGDLEPHIEVLEALVAQEPEAEDRDNLASLFAFELEKPRPPTPPPPSPKVRKTLSAAERKAKWEEREARAKERAAMTGKPTRAAHALAKAFTEEAGLVASSDTEPGPSTRRRREPSTVDTESRSRRPQRGVVGTEYFAVVSDKERREKERALDLVTESVAPQDQFARFNVGWVLPEGSKRRRSERPPDLKPVQSRARKGRNSAVSPEKTDNHTSPTKSVSSLSTLSSQGEEEDGEMPSRRGQSSRGTRSAQQKRKRETASASASALPPSATKRSRRVQAVIDSDDEMTPLPSSPVRGRNAAKARAEPELLEEKDMDDDADEEAEDEEEPEEDKRRSKRSTGRPGSRSAPRRAVTATTEEREIEPEDDPYTPGTLVWAKLFSFPFFPAEVIDEADDSDDEIPPAVFENREDSEAKNGAKGQKTWLVRFFDAQASYGWIPASKLDMLGESDTIDAMYLAGKEKGRSKGFKTPHLRTACRKAYREAMAQMAIEGEEDE